MDTIELVELAELAVVPEVVLGNHLVAGKSGWLDIVDIVDKIAVFINNFSISNTFENLSSGLK